MNPVVDLEIRSDEADALPTPNLPLLRKVLELVDADPKSWDQTWWARRGPECGTSFCIAGHVANLCGDVQWKGTTADSVLLPDGSSLPIWIFAQRELGLIDGEAYGYRADDGRPGLFDGGNTIFDVQRAAEAIAARAGEQL